ncbi:MAG: hypothetical protein HY868_00460 [Chloroflexi bacterium]|nr:hypothetical protein [Chloroflexota bacterium]
MKWQTLRHNGVAFPPSYDYRGLTVRLQGQPIKLNPEQEEMLMAWAKKKDTPYVHDAVFQKNFLDDFKTTLAPELQTITLDEMDWRELHAIADREKTANLSDEEKKRRAAERKATRDELKAQYGMAVIDGIATEIGAYLVEPPGILMGRGAHPLRGKWKGRVQPEEVTLNLDEDAPVPPAPAGHAWGKIVHEHDSMWIASWYDKLSDKRKYVWLADSSHLRQERDKEKYLKAAKLESSVERVRDEIRKLMAFEDTRGRASIEREASKLRAEIKSREEKILRANQVGDTDGRRQAENELARARQALEKVEKRREQLHHAEMQKRQLATVCYLIDRLAMRVGDEKDEDEADTVGASTLRVEHVRVEAERIDFNFLGKDSVLWEKSIARDETEEALARNLLDLSRGKQPGEQIFDKVDSTHINRFLSGIVPGLTAKVFRTYHATTAVRTKLLEQTVSADAPMHQKDYAARLANLNAAIVCNHKRTPPKNWEETLAKREIETEKLRAAKPDARKLHAQILARERALEKLLSAKPDPEKLAAQVKAREEALAKLRAQQAALPQLAEQVKARQTALEHLLSAQKPVEAAAHVALKKKQAALDALAKKKPPKNKKALAQHEKRVRAARKALAETKKTHDTKLKRLKERISSARKVFDAATKNQRAKTRGINKRLTQAQAALKRAQHDLATGPARYAERVAKAQAVLEQARQAPLVAQENYEERVERASLQLDLAKRTRDYNLGTSLKNYIDPRVYKSWGDHVGYDWKRLYTSALQRKFAWVEKERSKWKE